MSSLFRVRMLDASAGGRLALEVVPVHPDAGPPPETAAFALDLVLDLWRLLHRGFVFAIEECSLGAADATALAAAAPHGPRLEALDRLSNGEELPASTADHAALRASLGTPPGPHHRGRRAVAWGTRHGRDHFMHVEGDFAAFELEAALLVQGLATTPAPPGDYEPGVVLRFALDPDLAGWVRPGWSWETAVWR